MVKLSVVIVLYNEFELVRKCLTSIYRENLLNIEVIIIDNSSDKEGHKKIVKSFPGVKYIQSKEDLGFARGVNVGIKHSKGEFILALTPDMYLLPGTVEKTLDYIQNHPQIGMVGCRIFSSPNAQEPSAVINYPSLLTQLYYYNMPFYKFIHRIAKSFQPMYLFKEDHGITQDVKAVSGQYMLMRKRAVAQVNYFDPRFFLYFEDIDICKRLREKGWRVTYLPVGGMVQNGMSGWKDKVRITQALPPYMQSLYLFFGKHYGKTYAIIAWFTGSFSALISIPYLFFVSWVKELFNMRSQAIQLLPLWIRIVKWHFTKGLKLVFLDQ